MTPEAAVPLAPPVPPILPEARYSELYAEPPVLRTMVIGVLAGRLLIVLVTAPDSRKPELYVEFPVLRMTVLLIAFEMRRADAAPIPVEFVMTVSTLVLAKWLITEPDLTKPDAPPVPPEVSMTVRIVPLGTLVVIDPDAANASVSPLPADPPEARCPELYPEPYELTKVVADTSGVGVMIGPDPAKADAPPVPPELMITVCVK
jgi:hypothetical protein